MKDESHDREQQLLSAARSDAPPSGARQRVMSAMGLSAAASLAGAEVAAAKLQAATLTSAAGGSSLLLKAVGVGVAVGGLGMAALVGLNAEAPPEPRVAPSAVPSAVVPVPRAAVDAAPVASVAPTPAPVTSRKAAVPMGVPSVLTLPGPSARAPSPAIAEIEAERALIESARQALASGRASTAVKALNEYEARFGFGVLGHEQVALKVKALISLGRRAEATTLGERYLADRPNGTQAATIRRLLGESAAE